MTGEVRRRRYRDRALPGVLACVSRLGARRRALGRAASASTRRVGGHAPARSLAVVGVALFALVASGASGPVGPAWASARHVSTSNASAGSAASPAQATSGHRLKGLPYVALGDSYAAGYGVGAASGQPVAGCEQSRSDYPRQVARRLGLKLDDVTCVGAQTANVISTPQRTASGTAPPQSDALGASTRVVTVTIGGNDLGFASIVSSCVALGADGPVLADPKFRTCKALYDTRGIDSLVSRIEGPVLYGSPGAPSGLTAAFAEIRRRAPHARVFVVGYPAIAPDRAHTPSGGCFRPAVLQADAAPPYPQNSFPFTATDVAYLHAVEQRLDAGTRRAAERDGFTYISLLPATEAHSACARSGAAYVNGISVERVSRSQSVTVAPGALHPNAQGVSFIARTVARAVERSFAGGRHATR